jgi:hypothetical protein
VILHMFGSSCTVYVAYVIENFRVDASWKWEHFVEHLVYQCCGFHADWVAALQQTPILFVMLLKCVLLYLLFRNQFVTLMGRWPRTACRPVGN